MKDETTKEYHAAQDAFLMCKDVSQLDALRQRLDDAEKAYRAARPGAYYQAQQQVATLEAPVGPSACQRRSLK